MWFLHMHRLFRRFRCFFPANGAHRTCSLQFAQSRCHRIMTQLIMVVEICVTLHQPTYSLWAIKSLNWCCTCCGSSLVTKTLRQSFTGCDSVCLLGQIQNFQSVVICPPLKSARRRASCSNACAFALHSVLSGPFDCCWKLCNCILAVYWPCFS